MNRSHILALFVLLSPFFMNAQKIEGGLFLGAANYYGDVVDGMIDLEETNLSYGILMRYFWNEKLALRGNALVGKVSGKDANSASRERKKRGYGFESFFLEFSGMLEWNFHRKRQSDEKRNAFPRITPYGFVGLGVTFIDPNMSGLSDNAPESNMDMPHLLFTLPVGGGLKLGSDNRMVWGIEGGIRPAFSDLLDGISASGNPDNNDWYSFIGMTVSFDFQEKN